MSDAQPAGPPPAGDFQALYRRFRPQRFDELRGQEHVSLALRNAVRNGRVAHAYLLSGPRGTGKTSSARILAKALNCTESTDGEPCGHCASCLAIAAGTSFDVHELDAASSNGVEAMRELIGRVALATPGRWKVYIVDEVHMLSAAASNALLKTLEEPPPHVVFVLATTESQKVLPTIRSRTQHFEFHLLDEAVLDSLLADVAGRAGLELEPGTIELVTRRAKGSARDALSALDQVVAGGVLDDDRASLAALLGAVAEQDAAAALGAVDAAVRAGNDPEQLAIELVDRLRAGLLHLVAPDLPAAAALEAEQREAETLGLGRCVRLLELLGTSIVAMRDAPDPRITLELALVRAAHPAADDSAAAVLERLEQLERRVASLAEGAPRSGGGAGSGPPGVSHPAGAPGSVGAPGSAGAPGSVGAPGSAGGPGSAGTAQGAAAPVPQPAPAAATGTAAQGRPALGSYRLATAAGSSPAPPDGPRAAGGARPAPPPDPPLAPEGATAPAPAGAVQAAINRDELVAAWGDRVLGSLPLKLRAYYAAGRFVGAEPGPDGSTVGVFAVPNAAHRERAEPLRPDVEQALSSQLSARVTLRLVADDAPPTSEGPGSPAPASPHPREDADDLADLADLDDLVSGDDAPPAAGQPAPAGGLAWAEGRLLQAFPGAEEV